jgi:virulence-associated protein VagC
VRIPSELAFLEPATDVEIERVGDSLVLRPVAHKTLADLPAILSAFSPDFMAQGRDRISITRSEGLPLMIYMLDTNICIYLIRTHPPQVLGRLSKLRQGQALLSVVTYAELRARLEMQSRHRQQDEEVLSLLIDRIPACPSPDSKPTSRTTPVFRSKTGPSASSSDPAPLAWTRPGY